LRPGEKLYEELLADGENTKPTYHEKIMIAKTQSLNANAVCESIEKLCKVNIDMDNQHTVTIIKELVPEFKSNNSIFEKLDKIHQV
jgi:FlaA1/EpsC-like NDP-sugar epimerase